jgi:hypothetical protein
MGWTSYHASHYKNGRVDRKAECDAYFLEGLNRGYFDVLKSSMVGSTYYAAVKPLKKSGGKDKNGNYIYVDMPEEEQRVFAVVFLTSTDKKDYFNFSYKDMCESMGPYECDCPKSILDLLSPTDNENAKEWRKACYERHANKKKYKTSSLSRLPVGSVIRVTMPCRTTLYKDGDVVTLTKGYAYGLKRPAWFSPRARFTSGLMKLLEDHYEVIKRGEC